MVILGHEFQRSAPACWAATLPPRWGAPDEDLAVPQQVVRRLTARAQVDGRADDTEKTIALRHGIYRDQTEPLLESYCRRSLLVDIDGRGTAEEVFDRVSDTLDHLGAVAV